MFLADDSEESKLEWLYRYVDHLEKVNDRLQMANDGLQIDKQFARARLHDVLHQLNDLKRQILAIGETTVMIGKREEPTVEDCHSWLESCPHAPLHTTFKDL